MCTGCRLARRSLPRLRRERTGLTTVLATWAHRVGWGLGVAGGLARALAQPELGDDPWAGAGPLHSQFGLTLAPGHRTEVLGPLFYSEIRETKRTVALPPFFSYTQDPRVNLEEIDFLYPLGGYDRFGGEYRFHLFQWLNWSGGRNLKTDRDVRRFNLFPLYWQQRSPVAEQNYTAVFPFYGHLQNRLFRDETQFTLWPLYVKTVRRSPAAEGATASQEPAHAATHPHRGGASVLASPDWTRRSSSVGKDSRAREYARPTGRERPAQAPTLTEVGSWPVSNSATDHDPSQEPSVPPGGAGERASRGTTRTPGGHLRSESGLARTLGPPTGSMARDGFEKQPGSLPGPAAAAEGVAPPPRSSRGSGAPSAAGSAGAVTTRNYFVPFFHLRSGPGLEGWQLWPLVGREHKTVTTYNDRWGDPVVVAGHEKTFVAWPFYLDDRTGLGTTNVLHQQLVMPLFSRTRSPERDSTSYGWPIGYTVTDDRARRYREWDAPWPFVVFARGEGKTTDRVWPLFSRAHDATRERSWYAWPLYWHDAAHTETLQRERNRIMFFLYSDVVEKSKPGVPPARRTDLWPLFTARRDADGRSRFQALSVLEPLLANNKSIERNYSPLWSVWRAEADPASGRRSQSALWNLYRHEVTPTERKTSVLFGLFQSHKHAEGRRVRVCYIPFGPKPAPVAGRATTNPPASRTRHE